MRTTIAALLMAAMGWTAAGCGDDGDPVAVATAEVPAAPAGPTGTASETAAPAADETIAGDERYAQALSYVSCMRGKGVTVPDPVEGEITSWVLEPLGARITDDGVQLAGGDDGGMDIATIERNNVAYDECKSLLPDTWPLHQDPQDVLEQRAWRECMREQGVDIPEPDAEGNADGSPLLIESGGLSPAETACRPLYQDPAVQAGNPGTGDD